VHETSRDFTFCAHAINESDVFVIEDATLDERFCDNPYVTGDLQIRFYAGAQLTTSDGFNIGTLCVIDNKARNLSVDQINALCALARQVINNFESRHLADKLRLRFLEKRMINSSKMAGLGEVASGVAHEINNPLAIIRGKADQLIRRLDVGNPDLQMFCADLLKIETTVDRIAKIVRSLNSYSRSGEKDPMTISSISDIVAETIDLCRQRFKDAGIDLRYLASENAHLACRPVQISQVLMNLLSNAFDAVINITTKWVSVEVLILEKSLQVRVADSGPGIQQAVAARIMNPFFTTKAIGKGTGLGLSIANGIAEDHGGTLRYEPESPNTLFVLELPLQNSKHLRDVS